jgi:type I restriction enzyme, S subunit
MSEWKEYNLEDLAFYYNGKAFKPSDWKKEGVKIIRIEQLNNPEGFYDYYKGEFPEINKIENGDLIFSWSATLKVVIWKHGNAVLNQHLFKVVPKSFIEKKFLFFILDYNMLKLGDTSHGSTMKHIKRGELEKYFVKIPEPPTQRKIARILSTADAVIEKTQAAIAKYKAIKQGMLHDLFTRGIDTKTGKVVELRRNQLRPKYQDAPELYKESKLGWIPKEWEVFRLEEIADYVDYRGKTPPKSDFGVFLVTARNIKDGYIDYEVSKEYIREDAFESAMSRGKAKLGDVLITTEAPLGNVAQIDKEDIALAQRVIKYRGFENKLDNDYLGRFLMSDIFQRQLYANATGSTVLGIKGSRLHRLFICVPKPKEQESIVKSIISTENKMQTEQNYLRKLQQIKAGLMADLLSGKKEVLLMKKR